MGGKRMPVGRAGACMSRRDGCEVLVNGFAVLNRKASGFAVFSFWLMDIWTDRLACLCVMLSGAVAWIDCGTHVICLSNFRAVVAVPACSWCMLPDVSYVGGDCAPVVCHSHDTRVFLLCLLCVTLGSLSCHSCVSPVSRSCPSRVFVSPVSLSRFYS